MGKPKHSTDTRGDQKGAQTHDEGQHGDKAYEARKAEINRQGRDADDVSGGSRAMNDPSRSGSDAELHERKIANPALERDGKHRLFENRTQHDNAEQGSERNRRDVDAERHDHPASAFQGQGIEDRAGGAEPPIHETGRGGGNRSDADRGGHRTV